MCAELVFHTANINKGRKQKIPGVGLLSSATQSWVNMLSMAYRDLHSLRTSLVRVCVGVGGWGMLIHQETSGKGHWSC